jgi:2-polyprenyl-3-methyl-5-hydroxy-6-metoxy-1,4-benzoquinol methylase
LKNKLDAYVKAYEGNNLYDFDNTILLNWYSERIIKLNKGAGSILELGLGHGYTTDKFSQYFKKHIVLDGSKSVIENFKKTFPACKAQIIETYFENYNTEEKFDIIVLGFILEHVDDSCLILSKFRKFLAPGGKMYVAVPNAEVLNRRLGKLAGLLTDLQTLSDNDKLLGHKRYYTKETLINDIKKSGYNIETIEGIYLKPFTTSQMVSLNLNANIIKALCEIGINYPELSCGILTEIKDK